MGILGGRETSRTRRPPGKKGVGSVRRGPTRIRRRPSPPTCRAWFPRLRLLPLLRPANHAPTSVATSQSTLPAVRRLGPTAPLLQLLYRARDPFRGPPNNSVVKCARSSWTLEGGTRGDFSGALLAYRSKKRFSLRPLPRPRLPSRSRFPFHRFTWLRVVSFRELVVWHNGILRAPSLFKCRYARQRIRRDVFAYPRYTRRLKSGLIDWSDPPRLTSARVRVPSKEVKG